MKKIILTLAIIFGGLVSAQDYYDTYPADYNGYEYYNNSYDYPDDYYYNYPADYYPDQYYQGYYNDYRQAVYGINWNRFFGQYRLTPWQIDQIIALNNRFANFAAWDMYYHYNPDRWYYDRFFALQNILGPQIFIIYQNNYFSGRSPIVFYRNRFANFYARRYPVSPVYRNVNINIYRIDRNNFRDGFRNAGRNQGMINTGGNSGIRNSQNPRSGANGNNLGSIRETGSSGVRIQNDNIRNQGTRNSDNIRVESDIRTENSGIRNNSFPRSNGNVRSQQMPDVRQESPVNSGGFRQNQNSERRMENRGSERSNQRNSAPSSQGSRGSGMRLAAG